MDGPPDGLDMMQLLEETGVHEGWKSLFQKDPDFLSLLRDNISRVEKNVHDYNKRMVPERRKILLALSRCPPQDVKVILLGHDPIYDESLATGFSFSFPKEAFIDKDVGQRELPNDKGKSLAVLHDVLVEAGYLERGADYDSCHEVWADRGVLLLNASLTYSWQHQHFPIWQQLVSEVLCYANHFSKQKRLFFLCWGTNAWDISQDQFTVWESNRHPAQKITDADHSHEIDDHSRLVVFCGHHPTYPRDDNQFAQQATNQFRAIRKWYPDLFTLPKQVLTPADPVPETNEHINKRQPEETRHTPADAPTTTFINEEEDHIRAVTSRMRTVSTNSDSLAWNASQQKPCAINSGDVILSGVR